MDRADGCGTAVPVLCGCLSGQPGLELARGTAGGGGLLGGLLLGKAVQLVFVLGLRERLLGARRTNDNLDACTRLSLAQLSSAVCRWFSVWSFV